MQKFLEVNTEKENKIMTGQTISLLNLQETRKKAPIFTWWKMMGKYYKQHKEKTYHG